MLVPIAILAAALVGLLVMHGIYWLMTHPVNKFWLADQPVRTVLALLALSLLLTGIA